MSSFQSCTNNTTECLLQRVLAALEDANNSYDWDPLTFGFTVAIGIIALWFALVPVAEFFRHIIFKPEMLKYDENAIGPWTIHTKGTWLWKQTRKSVTVYTPLLDFDSLLQLNDLYKYFGHLVSTDDGATIIRKDRKTISVSSWFPLLHQLHMDDIHKLQYTRTRLNPDCRLPIDPFQLVPWQIDVLPADFAAVPALGSVHAITLLAITVGCDSIGVKDGYPFLRGSKMQLEFRPHSTRAVVAVFSNFSDDQFKDQKIVSPPIVETYKSLYLLKMNVENSLGYLRNPSPFVEAPLTHPHDHALCYKYPQLIPGCPAPYTLLGGHIQFEESDDDRSFYLPYLLVHGDIPFDIMVFPAARLRLAEVASAFAACSKFWSSAFKIENWNGLSNPQNRIRFMEIGSATEYVKQTWFNRSPLLARPPEGEQPQERAKKRFQLEQTQRREWNLLDMEPEDVNLEERTIDGYRECWKCIPSNSNPTHGLEQVDEILILQDAVNIVFQWLHDPFSLRAGQPSQRKENRQFIYFQLVHLDCWLSYCQDKATEVAGHLSDDVNWMLRDLRRSTESLDIPPFPFINKTIHQIRRFESSNFRGMWAEEQEYLARETGITETKMKTETESAGPGKSENLALLRRLKKPHRDLESGYSLKFCLIFRALLYGALLSCAADNSVFDDLETMDHIVPFI